MKYVPGHIYRVIEAAKEFFTVTQRAVPTLIAVYQLVDVVYLQPGTLIACLGFDNGRTVFMTGDGILGVTNHTDTGWNTEDITEETP